MYFRQISEGHIDNLFNEIEDEIHNRDWRRIRAFRWKNLDNRVNESHSKNRKCRKITLRTGSHTA